MPKSLTKNTSNATIPVQVSTCHERVHLHAQIIRMYTVKPLARAADPGISAWQLLSWPHQQSPFQGALNLSVLALCLHNFG